MESYVIFEDLLLSLSMRNWRCGCVSVVCLLLLLCGIPCVDDPQFIHLVFKGHLGSLPHPQLFLPVVNKAAVNIVYKFYCEHMSILGCMHKGVIVGSVIKYPCIFIKTAKFFLSGFVILFCIYTNTV